MHDERLPLLYERLGAVRYHSLPKPVQIAVGIDGFWTFVHADAYLGRLTGLHLHDAAARGGLDVDEADVMFLGHGVRLFAHADFERTAIKVYYHGQVKLHLALGCVWDEFLHLFAAADGHLPAIHELDDHVATHLAMIEFGFHSLINLKVNM